jgi:lipid-binding SYLF domain-containing protein
MAYATTNPPVLTFSGALTRGNPNANASEPTGQNIWAYSSADAAATVNGAGYFTNGGDLGMKLGDIVLIWNTAGALSSISRVSTVAVGSPGAVSLTQLVAPA